MDTHGYAVRTPIAFLIFNRPETTRRVFEAIRRARPRQLFVVADGPRPHKAGESDLCRATRAILDDVDWPCEVVKEFSDVNLGCRRRISSGLDRVFDAVEEAIILEDDCLPDPTFFRFCDELLPRYRDDARVGLISGDNFLFGTGRHAASYYFSIYTHIWGWASWRRSWRHYGEGMGTWPGIRKTRFLDRRLGDPVAAEYWTRIFDRLQGGTIDSWAYQLQFVSFVRGSLTALPRVNLVSNIGFAAGATHTTGAQSPFADMPVTPIDFPLAHPSEVGRDAAADRTTERVMFSGTLKVRRRLKMRMARLFRLR